jgi:hypothetical protein
LKKCPFEDQSENSFEIQFFDDKGKKEDFKLDYRKQSQDIQDLLFKKNSKENLEFLPENYIKRVSSKEEIDT